MSDKPKLGAEKWTWDGIKPARAFWLEVEAYRKAINELVPQVHDTKLQLEMLQLINAQGSSLISLRDALHELDKIGIEAKRDRLNGENP